MQDKSESFSEFTQRTDALASQLKIRVIDLPNRLRISEDMLMGYRTGRYRISSKAWQKLSDAELRLMAVDSPQEAVATVEERLSANHYGERPLDSWLKPTEESPEKIAAALLHAAAITHVWLADTESLSSEYIDRLEALAHGQKLSKEAQHELPKLTQQVRRRREKLAFMQASVVEAFATILKSSRQ